MNKQEKNGQNARVGRTRAYTSQEKKSYDIRQALNKSQRHDIIP